MRTYPPCWVLKARIHKHRGKLLLFHDKCPGFFYVHYTTHGTNSFTSHPKDEAIIWLSVLLKDTSAATGQAGIRTHILTTSEHAQDCSATTLFEKKTILGGGGGGLKTAIRISDG